jgi:hypothetical protein
VDLNDARAPRIAIVALRDSHECTLDIGFRASVKDLCLLSDRPSRCLDGCPFRLAGWSIRIDE